MFIIARAVHYVKYAFHSECHFHPAVQGSGACQILACCFTAYEHFCGCAPRRGRFFISRHAKQIGPPHILRTAASGPCINLSFYVFTSCCSLRRTARRCAGRRGRRTRRPSGSCQADGPAGFVSIGHLKRKFRLHGVLAILQFSLQVQA